MKTGSGVFMNHLGGEIEYGSRPRMGILETSLVPQRRLSKKVMKA